MPTADVNSTLTDLRARLDDIMIDDRRALLRRLDRARGMRDPHGRTAAVAEVAAALDVAEQRVAGRRARVPRIGYPAELPISQRRDDIAAAIRDHQVVIVAGETGSGKTTQLPKICLELGRGVRGMIGHTQPRRLAARTVAERVAEELATPLGDTVGYKVRFTDRVGGDTLVKLMTDGILLAELGQDRSLSHYDTLIVDEAHERSLNIDFILGYLRRLLPRRPDLKVVITSATIDPQRFSRHFGDAPVIEVSGRAYPVEVRYRPLVAEDAASGDDTDRDQIQAICEAVDELCAEGPGDILVFLSGEREIRDTADALGRHRGDLEVLPLYARLSAAEQHRVFQAHSTRRVVLATNVAETSLTVPGIRYVVDPGTARISRYSHRSKVQRLPIEAVSQASANQRTGRCGRTSDGICVRLYTEQDFLSRPEFTDPEIVRTNLAAVILAMTALGLGDVADFPFVDPPDRRSVADGVALLHELGALDGDPKDARRRLTPLGRRLAQLPVDPRLGRMLLEADRNGCLDEVLVIVSALSIQDPRERPVDSQQAAADRHARFVERESEQPSDFTAFLRLWEYLRERQAELSSNQFRRLCRAEFLNYLRIREWQDIHGQLRSVCRSMGLSTSRGGTPADVRSVHVSLLAGLLSHIGVRDAEGTPASRPGRGPAEFQGARNARFAVFPGSALAKRPPRWVMAAELVETSRLWARVVARIEPEWVEPLAEHLVKRSYSEPHWEKKRAAVVAYEKVTLYGVPIVTSRPVNYAAHDPQLCRELFIRHALVEGDWQTHHRFFHDNRRLLDEVGELENRVRRRDIVVDDETLFDFYDARIPAEVVSGRHFDSWWKKARRSQPDLLSYDRAMLVDGTAAERVRERDYPDVWEYGELRLPLTYRFEPGAQADGVTVHVPLSVMNQVGAAEFDWQVPGLREELVTALIRALPKQYRRNLVPVRDHAAGALARIDPSDGPLLDVLGEELTRRGGVPVPRDAWAPERVPDHLRVTFRVVDEGGRELAVGKDLEALRRRLGDQARSALAEAAGAVERRGLRRWDFGAMPDVVERERAGHVVRAYPALVDEGDSVAIRTVGSEAERRAATWRGVRRLLLLNTPSPFGHVRGRLSNAVKLVLTDNPHGSVAALVDDCVTCAADRIIAENGGPATDAEGFAVLLDRARERLDAATLEVVTVVARVLAAAHDVRSRMDTARGRIPEATLADVRAQLDGLVHPGFVTATGHRQLPELVRYLRAVERRFDKLPDDPARDRERMLRVQEVEREYRQLRDAAAAAGQPAGEALRRVRWMIEELRVSYFAQQLGTAHPVSEKRIFRALDALAP